MEWRIDYAGWGDWVRGRNGGEEEEEGVEVEGMARGGRVQERMGKGG